MSKTLLTNFAGSYFHNMIDLFPYQGYIVSDRCGVIESRHTVNAAVVDASGKLLYTVGNSARMTLARSAAKPLQALAVLETHCFDKFGLDEGDLALMCASHNSEDRHINRALAMLAKSGAKEEDLACGGHSALSEAINRSWIKNDFIPTAVCNNCSGKHAGLLAGARALGAELVNYNMPQHRMQIRVKQVVEDVCNLVTDEIKWGVDGCNLPTPATPLRSFAQAYASFAAAIDATSVEIALSPRTKFSARIFKAMTNYPELVGGTGRFCTALMTTFQGTLIGKVGADGFYAIGVRQSEHTKALGSDGAIGIAVKIEDGNTDILYSAVVEILKQLEIGTLAMREELASFHGQGIYNTAGVLTGHISHQFTVQSAAE